jgi:hypothetical protein
LIKKGEFQVKKVVNLEDYREKKKEEDPFAEFESEFKEIPEEEFAEMLNEDGSLKFSVSDDYVIYNDDFIRENAEHIAHYNIPRCTICNRILEEGDRVDQMWPLEYGHNVCRPCEEKLPKKMKKEKVVNLDKVELILIEEDFKKIMNHLGKRDIINIIGNKIIPQEVFYKIKYNILGMEDDLNL